MTTLICLVLVTAPSIEEAQALAQGLVENHLAACVSIVPGLTSVYRWQGQIETARECLLICKTSHATWPALRDWVKAHHSYTVPEIVQVPIVEGLPAYLNWVCENTSA